MEDCELWHAHAGVSLRNALTSHNVAGNENAETVSLGGCPQFGGGAG